MANPIDFAPHPAPPYPRESSAIDGSASPGPPQTRPVPTEKCQAEILELICCIAGAKAEIAEQLTGLVNRSSAVPVLRNMLVLVEILGKLDFDALSRFARALSSIDMDRISQEPLSLWQIFRSAEHPDVRRGLELLVLATQALGRTAR